MGIGPRCWMDKIGLGSGLKAWKDDVPHMSLIPWAIRRLPVESWTPRMTDLGVYLPMRSIRPGEPGNQQDCRQPGAGCRNLLGSEPGGDGIGADDFHGLHRHRKAIVVSAQDI